MSCEACQKLLISDSDAPHDGLLTYRNPSILRPFGRPPVVLHRYRCKHCGFNWIRETDPLEGDRSEWICLYQASNILVPATADCPSSIDLAMPAHSFRPAIRQRHPQRTRHASWHRTRSFVDRGGGATRFFRSERILALVSREFGCNAKESRATRGTVRRQKAPPRAR